MARLGRDGYELLLELSAGEHPARLVEDRYVLDNGLEYPKELIVELSSEGMVSVRALADKAGEEPAGRLIRLEPLGRDRLEDALARSWKIAESGASATDPSFWHEFVDPLTRARFVVNVADVASEKQAMSLATAALASREARERARGLQKTGWENGFTLTPEGSTAEVVVWKKR